MNFLIISLYLLCYYYASRKSWSCLFLISFLEAFFLCINMFNQNISLISDSLGLFFMPILFGYNIVVFTTFAFLNRYLYWGGGVHAFLLTAMSTLGLIIPLNPLILLYNEFSSFLPVTDIPALNLFILNLFPTIIFKFNIIFYIALASIISYIFFTERTPASIYHKPLNIVVVQVGLYLRNNGFNNNIYNDLEAYIKGKKVDLIVFSENVFFGHKNDYIKKKTDIFINNLKDGGYNFKYGIVMNLYGYNDINNVVSVFWHKNSFITHQKTKLIPFFEKRSVFNSYEPLSSSFLYYNKEKKQNIFNIKQHIVGVHICYEALFPEIFIPKYNISLIQSDYSRLNGGYNYDNVLINGSILSKFAVAPNIPFINVQNYGGTVLIKNDWTIDMGLFNKSKTEAFLYVQL
ncbi:TPA: acyltransferase [Escherichia coli]|jgi:apolipoprotein N-acyltransferase|nr:acyltransferase [Escherichia coli]EKN0514047.1 acyltransferase [Escherichia coli]NUJ46964.1 acyltransferase [Escherichia coli]HAV7599134.1 acyltransferase [Escherichia coli]HAV9780793.1 acyltransferase [Escherichia coli]